jgi:translocation and assembly module TamB
MRRAYKWLIGILLALVGLPLLLVFAIVLGANTDPGRRTIEALAPKVTGGEVRIQGLSGRFPDNLRIQHLTVADQDGVWLTVNDAALDWWPRRLLGKEVRIDRLEAQSVAVDRLPKSNSKSSTTLPSVRVELDHFGVNRLEIAAAVSGRPMTLAVDGSARIAGPGTGNGNVTITAPGPADGGPPDHYVVDATVDPSQVHATISVAERPNGLISGLAGLPDLGAVAISATVEGPLEALATKAAIQSGPLNASLDGTVDMVAYGADLAISVVAPAMTPGPGIGWSSIHLDGTVHGPFASPEAKGTVSIDDLTAAGAAIGSLRANLAGNATGETELHAIIDRLRLPGPSPELLASAPLTLDATARLREDNWPVRFSLRHPLVTAEGTADVTKGQASLTMPDLSPFVAIAGVDVLGAGHFDVGAARSNDGIDVTVTGGIGLTGGANPLPALVGDTGTIDLAASINGQDVKLTRLALSGHAFRATANGQFIAQRLAVDWTIALTELDALRSGTSGSVEAHGHAGGTLDSLSVTADLTGDVAAEVGRFDRFTVHASASGLPNAPEGQLTATGTVLDAPVDVSIAAARRGEGTHVAIDRANWKSLSAQGMLDFNPADKLPTGTVTAKVGRLADLAAPLGRPVTGQITASLEASPTATLIKADATGVGLASTGSVGQAVLRATVTNPAGKQAIDGTLALDGIEADGIRAVAHLAAKGPLDALAVSLTANSPAVQGMPARIETAGTLNTEASTLSLASLQAALGPETIRLLAPVRIGYGQPLTIDKLRLGVRQGELAVTARVDPGPGAGGLNMTATLMNLPADVLASFAPAYAADGTIAGEAHLTGNPARPAGTIRLTATGLRMRSGPGRALPVAAVNVAATLDGANARVDARLNAGTSAITVSGSAPLDIARPMDLRIGGNLDLAMVNPLVAAQGRQVKGRLDLALGAGGTATAPRVTGTARLSGGDLQDVTLGVHISAITVVAQANGDTIRLDRFSGTAGQGTISGSGTVGLTGSLPVDLSLRASNAKILASDLATAVIDANLTLRGPISSTPTLAGTVFAHRADIQIPEKLPPSIAVLPIRDPRAPKARPASNPGAIPAPPAPAPDIALNLTLDAPGQIYVRGRGLGAELGGRIIFTGTAEHPLPQGGLHLRRGTFSLAGQSLNFTEGTIDFSGGSVTNPTLKFVATSVTSTMTATLTVSGDVRDPKIVLSSVPDMPQDEILAQILFHTTSSKLSVFQMAEIAAALASLSGIQTPGGDPLARIRSALGLDQLSVGTGAGGGATLQAGRYITPGVRVGASQGTAGQTQATVQVDIAKGLKLETTVGTGGEAATPTPGVSNGTSVGVTYQLEY